MNALKGESSVKPAEDGDQPATDPPVAKRPAEVALDGHLEKFEDPEPPSLNALLVLLKPGIVVDDKYVVKSHIGRGGMGVVVAARHTELGRDVALKFLCYSEGSSTTDFRARFRREAQINAKLKNEHITRVLDVGRWKSSSYIVMERLEGTDLRRKLKAGGGKFPLDVALDYIVQLCEGIAEVHAHGIVHRDLKPSNLFLTTNTDGSDLIKIMDFGISKWRDGDPTEIGELTKAGTVLGSPKYMAPEQIFGAKTIDVRADIWSIGAIFYEMLAGTTPYNENGLANFCAALIAGPPPRLDSVNPAIPAGVADVVARCFERDPAARMQSVAELAGGLLDATAGSGNTLRERLGAIIAMKPIESRRRHGDDVSVSLPAGLGLSTSGPPSVSNISKGTPLAVSGATVVSASSPPPAAKRSRVVATAVAVLAAAALGAVVMGWASQRHKTATAAPASPAESVASRVATAMTVTAASATAASATATSASAPAVAVEAAAPAASASGAASGASTAASAAPPPAPASQPRRVVRQARAPAAPPPTAQPTAAAAPAPPKGSKVEGRFISTDLQ